MQTNTNNIRVSVFPEIVRADMKVTQNDIDTNEVIVRVFDQSDVEIDYATITSALIIFTKPDYHVVQGNMTVREADLYYKMGTNEIAVKGDVKAQIQLIGSSGERLTIGGFSFPVQADPVTPWTVQSTSEYGILHSLIVEAQTAINNVEAFSVWENYDPEKAYVPMNKVVYGGSCYINLAACQGVLPTDASKWLKIASRGEDGADGKDGADGTDGIDATITIGTVTTGAPGTYATVTNVGTPSAAVLNFTVPKGDKGDPMTIDASGILADKSLYDDELKGFSFLATDTGKIYFKNSNTSGDWSDPISFEGPAGQGVPQGGTVGQFLRKNSNADYETLWSDLPINNTLTSTSTTEALSAAQGKILKDEITSHKAENASKFAVLERYALASVTGQALTVTVANGKELGDREPIMVEVDSAVTGGAITVNYNNAGALALKDIDGNAVTELAKGLYQFQYRTGSPNFFVLAPRGGANVKSIQRGVIIKDSGVTFVTQSIEPVTLANAILLITFKGSSSSSISPNKYAVLGKFKTSDGVTSSQLQFEVYTTGLAVPISWQVIEFNNVKSLQRGILTQVFNATNYNITINSVNLAKSFLITTFKYNQPSPVSGGATLLSKLTSNTNINVEHFDDSTERTIAWQVVEFN